MTNTLSIDLFVIAGICFGFALIKFILHFLRD